MTNLKKEIVENMISKYEIETLEPNEDIKDWFIEFYKDCNNLIEQALSSQKQEFEKMIDEMKPYDEEGNIYPDLISREELKSKIQEIK